MKMPCESISRKWMLMSLVLLALVFLCVYYPIGTLICNTDSASIFAAAQPPALPQPQRDRFFLNKTESPLSPGTQPSRYTPAYSLRLFPCDWSTEKIFRPIRSQAFLRCDDQSAILDTVDVSANMTPSVPSLTSEQTPCLKRVIKERCYDPGLKIPRLAHYVYFGKLDMPFGTFLSVVAMVRFNSPCLVLFHGDTVPFGRYWRALISLVPNVMHVQMERPRSVMGQQISVVEHSSDVARLRIVKEYGGTYLDTDHLVLRNMDDLRQHSMVMGKETGSQLGNGFFLAEPQARFLQLWQANYSDFRDHQWAEHSTVRPKKLSLDHPELVHVVDTFFSPNYAQIAAFFSRAKVARYDWSQHYGVHLYRRIKVRLDVQDSVVGDMARHLLYGDRHACWRPTSKDDNKASTTTTTTR